MAQSGGEVLVEEVAQELADAVVGPASVDEEQALEVAELADGEVAGEHGLLTLLAADAHANMGSFQYNFEI